jgi:hypothetical protein
MVIGRPEHLDGLLGAFDRHLLNTIEGFVRSTARLGGRFAALARAQFVATMERGGTCGKSDGEVLNLVARAHLPGIGTSNAIACVHRLTTQLIELART